MRARARAREIEGDRDRERERDESARSIDTPKKNRSEGAQQGSFCVGRLFPAFGMANRSLRTANTPNEGGRAGGRSGGRCREHLLVVEPFTSRLGLVAAARLAHFHTAHHLVKKREFLILCVFSRTAQESREKWNGVIKE